jgi:hypothetical protein
MIIKTTVHIWKHFTDQVGFHPKNNGPDTIAAVIGKRVCRNVFIDKTILGYTYGKNIFMLFKFIEYHRISS